MDNTETVNVLEWCAGYGGIGLGLKSIFGKRLRVIGYSDVEGFVQADLVSKMEQELMDAAPVWTNLKTFPCEEFHGLVDIFIAGYPCQPFSHAGKREGTEDPRHLWPFIQRAVGIIRPRYCFFENVEGHITSGFKDICHDLGELGYELTAGIFSAAECGLPHQRKRLFIMAHRRHGPDRRWSSLGEIRAADGGTKGADQGSSEAGRSEAGQRKVNEPRRGDSEAPEGLANLPDIGIQGSGAVRKQVGETYGGQKLFVCDCSAGGIAPSRPGEPQFGFEPPRVVGNTARRQCEQLSGAVTKRGEAVGDSQKLFGSVGGDNSVGGGECGQAIPESGNTTRDEGRIRSGAKLNPRWVEILMGLPMGWTCPDTPASVIRNWPKFVSGWCEATIARMNSGSAEME